MVEFLILSPSGFGKGPFMPRILIALILVALLAALYFWRKQA
ncbi:hypothetical protein [Deinococcus cellulosilyticus]|nr:hypothetical protein [Deinococcus cellulosilyticus]